jgi:hypothetical protein
MSRKMSTKKLKAEPILRAEEAAIISGDYRDMIVNITCE